MKIIKVLICKLIGHRLYPAKYFVFHFQDGKTSWTQECRCCGKAIYCIKGYVESQPNHVFKMALDTSIEDIKSVNP